MEVYKAAHRTDNDNECIVVLTIPAGSRVRLSDDRYGKCRAERARVERIETLKGKLIDGTTAYSRHDNSFKYRVGRTVKPTKPFNLTNEECASGIHFFFVRKKAVQWARN